jgi:hypothetical protein
MGYRRFTDRAGRTWEIRDRSASEWEYHPVDGGGAVRVRAPGYDKDPFELSNEELQKRLDEAGGGPSRARKSPFQD